MKRFLIAPILALSLSGCVTTGTGSVNNVIGDVQATAAQICSFVPTAATVSQIIAAMGVPYIGMASEVATQICSAISRRSGIGPPRVIVNGRMIALRGQFVRRR